MRKGSLLVTLSTFTFNFRLPRQLHEIVPIPWTLRSSLVGREIVLYHGSKSHYPHGNHYRGISFQQRGSESHVHLFDIIVLRQCDFSLRAPVKSPSQILCNQWVTFDFIMRVNPTIHAGIIIVPFDVAWTTNQAARTKCPSGRTYSFFFHTIVTTFQ